jgi:hypothetical protein
VLIKRLLLLAASLTATASASTLIATGVDSATGLQDSVWINENGVATRLYFAGGVDITVDGLARLVYCVDLLTDIGVPGTYNTVVDYANTPNLERVGWLMQHEWPSYYYSGSNLQVQGAGLQLAIWDILTDNGDGFNSGIVAQSTSTWHPTNAAVLAAAVQYEADSLNKSSMWGDVYYNTNSSGVRVQTLMGQQAPEPAAVVTILSGLVLIGLGSLRRRRNGR